MEEPKKILLVRTDRIGDVLLSTPVIKNLKFAYPKSYIAFMCRPYTKEILEGNPYLDEVITYDKDKVQKGIFSSIKFSLYLRKKYFDWAIILHPTIRVHLVTFFAKIPTRIGWNAKKGWLLTKSLPYNKYEGLKHELEYTLDLLRFLDIPIVDKRPYFPIKEVSEKKVESLLFGLGIEKSEKFIVIHPSSSCPSKRWPIDYFIELVKILKKETNLKIIVISSKEEKEIVKPLLETGLVIDMAGKLSISETGSLLKRATIFISNDSGPVHIAAALDIPVISIFGRKNAGLSPTRWRPLSENSFYFHKDVGCSICLAHNCNKGFLCLKAIKPIEVAKKVLEIIHF
ncbi:MAG: lipopolysaccharide heptosyltransferase II [Candidatus Omnitrophica bacterium]|nr:lipopolysaccharide heptosyltransferase II [Candidatus Omnitrophota bacterium]